MPKYALTLTIPVQIDAENVAQAWAQARKRIKVLGNSVGGYKPPHNRDFIPFQIACGEPTFTPPGKA